MESFWYGAENEGAKRLKASEEEKRKRKAEKKIEVKTSIGQVLGAFRKPDPITPHEEEFRHSAWAPKRAQVKDALKAAQIGLNQQEAFANCGTESIVYYSEEEKRYRIGGKFCHSRFCEPCMRAKANLIAANLREKLEAGKEGQYRFLTLTLKHSDSPLREQIDKLRHCFKCLRTLPLWKNNCTGGAAVLEINWSKDTAQFHPHLHVIMEGDPIAKARIQEAWHALTGDSYVIDIKKLDSRKDTAYYVGKYIAKGSNNDLWWNEGAREEFIKAMQGQRSLFTFGTWRGFALLKKPEKSDSWKRVGSLDEIVARFRKGEKWAIQLLDKLWNEMRYDPSRKRAKSGGKPPDIVKSPL